MAFRPGQILYNNEIVLTEYGKVYLSQRTKNMNNPRVRTTEDEWTVQGNYGHGWEDLTSESTWTEIKQRLREYRENEPGTAFRTIKRRVKIARTNPAWSKVFG